MASAIKNSIASAVKDAMRAKDKARLGLLRVIMSEFKKVEVDERIELDDARILAILDKAVKQRRDAANQYKNAERNDLADIENYEISVIQDYLPTALTEDELIAIVRNAVEVSGANSMQDMGKVMSLVKPQVQGKADMGAVSKQVKAALAG